jgi:hypothetical protein
MQGMKTMIQLETDLPRHEADAVVSQRQVEPDRAPASVLGEEPENDGADKAAPLAEARRLIQAILRLDGLTGAEIEASERVLALDRADIRRFREIAGNHSRLNPEFFSLNGSGPDRQDNRPSAIRR